MSKSDVKKRAQMAKDWLAQANLVDQLGGDAGIAQSGNQVASSAIHAGIAAADAICGHYLGVRSSSGDHAAAATLLETAGPRGKALAKEFKRLIAEKTNSEYSPTYLSETKVKSLLRVATSLVGSLDVELRV